MMTRWVLIMGLAAAVSGAPRRSLPWEKNHLQIGQTIYRENCVVCHDIDRAQSKKSGPAFTSSSSATKCRLASREYIIVRVKFGGSLMPAFRQTLTDSEIDTLIDYIAAK